MKSYLIKHVNIFCITVSLLIVSAVSYAYGPIMKELGHTIEGSRIIVKVDNTRQSGTVTAELLDCNGCTPQVYVFDRSTVFINALGAKKPIEELVTWSGSQAMFHYRLADNHIHKIQIRP
jgi:hypothetical protein